MSEQNGGSLGMSLSKAIFTVRERYDVAATISSERFVNLLAELNHNTATTETLLDKINFAEGELRCDDLLARMELIRASLEAGENGEEPLTAGLSQEEIPSATRNGIILANSFASAESSLDPWKRTISQLSMNSILEPELACRVEVTAGSLTGSLFDRHRTYLVSVNGNRVEEASRRYRDFDWLHQALVHKYPFRIIPQIPGKGSLSSSLLASDDFIASRRRGLEEFLFLVLNHPILQKEPLLLEFLSVANFEEVRHRLNVAWQEEFALTGDISQLLQAAQLEPTGSTSATGAPLITDPDWQIYDDAQAWTAQVKDSIQALKQSLDRLHEGHGLVATEGLRASESIAALLANTQHAESTAGSVAKVFEALSGPHGRLADEFERTSARWELFLRLIIGCQEMIYRTRKLKYDRFAWLSDQIVSAQATAEKLRARDGPLATPELERALARVTNYQRDLLYQAKRNEFADVCLKHELGWVVKMCRALPSLLNEMQALLHQHYQVATELTNH